MKGGSPSTPSNKYNMRMGSPDDDGDHSDFGGGDARGTPVPNLQARLRASKRLDP